MYALFSLNTAHKSWFMRWSPLVWIIALHLSLVPPQNLSLIHFKWYRTQHESSPSSSLLHLFISSWLPIPLCIQYKISLLTFLLLSKALSTPVTFRPHSSHPSQQLQLLFWLLLTSGIMGAFNCAAPLQLITTSPLSARLYDVIQIETQKQ